MLSQEFEVTRSFVVWKVTPPRSRRHETVVSFLLGIVLNGFLIALTILARDWYGFANALAMIISTLVRVYVIGQQREAVDARVDELVCNANPRPPEGTYEAARVEWLRALKAERGARNGAKGENPHDKAQASASGQRPKRPDPKKFKADDAWTGTDTKVLIIQSDSKAVTFWMPQELLAPPSLFIEGPTVLHPQTYFVVRSIGWIAFAVHIVAIGMADLVSQMYTVALIVIPTILVVLKFSCDDSDWREKFDQWRRSLYKPAAGHEGDQGDLADEKGTDTNFVQKRDCWIGSRLKAEIYEWPASYEFSPTVPGDGEAPGWTSGALGANATRSKKRQDLYAWLALSTDEEDSMDKWDLFPHTRHNNKVWLDTYKKKRACLKRNPNFGPQLATTPEPDDRDSEALRKNLTKPRTTKTSNVASEAVSDHRQTRQASVMTGSSAFPAISDHDHPTFVSDDENNHLTESPVQTTFKDASRPARHSSGATNSGSVGPRNSTS
jgi:hypothetical protein